MFGGGIDTAEDELMAQALGADICDDGTADNDEVPIDGMAYLRSVMREAKKEKQVVVAPNANALTAVRPRDAVYTGREKGTKDVGREYLPTATWVRERTDEFARVRMKLARHIALVKKKDNGERVKVPAASDEKAWCLYCYGAEIWNKVCLARQRNAQNGDDDDDGQDENKGRWTSEMVNASTAAANNSGSEPHTTVISSLKPTACATLLEHHIEWADALEGVASRGMAAWIYALLARAEKPLHPDHVSAIRTLAMVCGRQRSNMLADHVAKGDGKGSPPPFVTGLSLLVCIVANYFSQSDLADA